jgi:YD repeat-containing protein
MHTAFGWEYTYFANGDVESKEKGLESYTFTYSSVLKVETISLNGLELHHFAYDANGVRVSKRRLDGRGNMIEVQVKASL